MHTDLTVSQEFSRDNPHFCLRRDAMNLPPSPQGFLNTTEKLFTFRPLRYYDNKLPYIIYSAAQHGHLLLIVSAGTNIPYVLNIRVLKYPTKRLSSFFFTDVRPSLYEEDSESLTTTTTSTITSVSR